MGTRRGRPARGGGVLFGWVRVEPGPGPGPGPGPELGCNVTLRPHAQSTRGVGKGAWGYMRRGTYGVRGIVSSGINGGNIAAMTHTLPRFLFIPHVLSSSLSNFFWFCVPIPSRRHSCFGTFLILIPSRSLSDPQRFLCRCYSPSLPLAPAPIPSTFTSPGFLPHPLHLPCSPRPLHLHLTQPLLSSHATPSSLPRCPPPRRLLRIRGLPYLHCAKDPHPHYPTPLLPLPSSAVLAPPAAIPGGHNQAPGGAPPTSSPSTPL